MSQEHNTSEIIADVRFEHDCDHCKSLGQHGEYDLYFCLERGPTVVARWGSEGAQYKSGLYLIADPDLAEAKRRATEAGLL